LLRTATPEDLEVIYDIELRCFKERRFRRDHVDWILRNERCLTLVEEDHGKPLGALMLLFDGRSCRVLSVAVVPEARRRGLGTGMMKATEEIARKRGCESIRLEVSTANQGAVEFYRQLGYRTNGILSGYYSWGEDAYSMSGRVPAQAPGPQEPGAGKETK
jgi:ribosomal protein S18 acetylase RimI-like enzyme